MVHEHGVSDREIPRHWKTKSRGQDQNMLNAFDIAAIWCCFKRRFCCLSRRCRPALADYAPAHVDQTRHFRCRKVYMRYRRTTSARGRLFKAALCPDDAGRACPCSSSWRAARSPQSSSLDASVQCSPRNTFLCIEPIAEHFLMSWRARLASVADALPPFFHDTHCLATIRRETASFAALG